MDPWVLLNLYNIKCRIKRMSRTLEWKDANLNFSCVLESPRGPLRFDLAVNFHDGGMRFMNLMRLQFYEVNFASRPRVNLKLSSSTSTFQVKTLKYRQAEKVRIILENVTKVIAKRSRTLPELISDHEEIPPDVSLYFPQPRPGTLSSNEQQEDFIRPIYQKQRTSLSHLTGLEKDGSTEILAAAVSKLSQFKLPAWASDVGGISLPKSTDCQSKFRSVPQMYSPVKLDGLLCQRNHEEAAPGITVFVESGPVVASDSAVDEFSSTQVFDQPDLVESSRITAVIDYD